VTDWGALVNPTVVDPKMRLPGVTVALTIVPVPDNATVCGLLLALSVKTKVAVRVPVAVGWNTILAVQLDEAARIAPQKLLTIAKSPVSGPDMETLVIGMATGLPSLKVAICTGLDVPTSNVPNVRLVGEAVALPIWPVPDKATVWGLFPAESENVSVAVRVPVVDGVKVTETVQLAEGARLAPQVLAEIAKSPALAPDIAMLFRLMGSDGPLVSVTVRGALAVCGAVGGNTRLDGETLALATAAVPVKATVRGLPAESVIVSVAVRVPAAEGVNETEMLQLEEGAKLAPQVLPEIAKSPAFAPEMAILFTLNATVPPFVNVTVCGALVEPTASSEKDRLVGTTLALSMAPIPESATVCGLLLAASAKVRLAARAPNADGVNAIPTVQLAEAAKVAPHVLLEIAKSLELAPVTETLLIEIAVAPLFCNVAVWGAEVDPRLTMPKERADGLGMASIAGVPLPDSETVWVGLLPVCVRVRVAVRVPVTVGSKVTVAMQLEPAKREAPQVLFEIEKSPALGPEIAMLLMAIVDELSFVSITCCEFPDAPMGTLDQERLAGFTLTPETEMQPVSSRAHPVRSRLRRSAQGLIRAGADRGFTSKRGAEFMGNGEIPAEPRPRSAGAIRGSLPGSCIFEIREGLPTFSDSIWIDQISGRI